MNTKSYLIMPVIAVAFIFLIDTVDDAAARGFGGGARAGGAHAGGGGFSRGGAAASGSFSSRSGQAGARSAGGSAASASRASSRSQTAQTASSNRAATQQTVSSRRASKPPPPIGRRPSRTASRLRARIRPSGNSPRVKTSRPARKALQTALKSGSKPRNLMMEIVTTTTMTTGMAEKLQP